MRDVSGEAAPTSDDALIVRCLRCSDAHLSEGGRKGNRGGMKEEGVLPEGLLLTCRDHLNLHGTGKTS